MTAPNEPAPEWFPEWEPALLGDDAEELVHNQNEVVPVIGPSDAVTAYKLDGDENGGAEVGTRVVPGQLPDASVLRDAGPQAGAGANDDGRREGPPALTVEDEALVKLLARGLTHEEAGKALGRSAKTVQRRRLNPAFAQALEEARARRYDELCALSTEGSIKVLQTLIAALGSERVADQLKAAELLLRHDLHLRSLDGQRDLARRVAELETELAKAQLADDEILARGGQ